MGTVVRLEDYCKSFKSAEVLKNINLTLESGKVIGLKVRMVQVRQCL